MKCHFEHSLHDAWVLAQLNFFAAKVGKLCDTISFLSNLVGSGK